VLDGALEVSFQHARDGKVAVHARQVDSLLPMAERNRLPTSLVLAVL
jgi:hypothetical protein